MDLPITDSRQTGGTGPDRRQLVELLRTLPIGFLLLDRDGRILIYNDEEARFSGRGVADVEGRSFFTDVAPCTNVQELEGVFRQAMAVPGQPLDEDLEFVFAFPGGDLDVRIRMRKVMLGGEPHAVLLIDDNTRLKAAQKALQSALEQAREQSLRDPLTSLYNRRHLSAVLPNELSRAVRHGDPLSLLIVDLDGLKGINDHLGHPFGDRVLTALGRCLKDAMRASDLCFRTGGDEFCALLPNTAADKAVAASERLREKIRQLRFEEHPEVVMTVSIGVATHAPPAAAIELSHEELEREAAHLFLTADRALYHAKNAGRDRTAFQE